MERVAFLVEKSGERIPCLLNPASIVLRRTAGVRVRSSSRGPIMGAALQDDPLLYTGGGTTELLLDLLFDVSLVTDSAEVIDNVQTLTRPLTDLAEGAIGPDGYGQVPLIRFIWGKAWNILGVVSAIAERLENFTSSGAPQRSWLRMRMLRVTDTAADDTAELDSAEPLVTPDADSIDLNDLNFHQVQGTGDDPDEGSSSERLDEIAAARYGDPSWWKVIANFNNIDDPWAIPPGQVLAIPPGPSSSEGTA